MLNSGSFTSLRQGPLRPRVHACQLVVLGVPGRGRFSVKDCARWHRHETISTRISGFRKEYSGEEQEVGQDRQKA
jgi:hypothetical protein